MCAASRQELAEVLRQTRDYLEALRDDGVTKLEVSLEAAARLQAPRRARQAAAPVREPARAAPVPAPVQRSSARPAPAPAPSVQGVPTTPPADSDVKATLARVAAIVARCTRCPLHRDRTRTVPGQGNLHPELMFVGEGPGAEEDRQGLAFVGDAGQLLTRMIQAMGLTRDDVFIANVVKCRPPGNRQPAPDEMATCLPYLREQIGALKPKVIVALGATAAHALLAVETPISRLRGQWTRFEGIDLMPTFHPAYLLRNPASKREVWADLQLVLKRLGRTPPPAKPSAGS